MSFRGRKSHVEARNHAISIHIPPICTHHTHYTVDPEAVEVHTHDYSHSIRSPDPAAVAAEDHTHYCIPAAEAHIHYDIDLRSSVEEVEPDQTSFADPGAADLLYHLGTAVVEGGRSQG